MTVFHVFVSHSQKDKSVNTAVRRAFVGLRKLKPFFLERKLTTGPPSGEIVDKIEQSRAVFLFLTRNSMTSDTRDWIVFEVGVATAHSRPIYAWKARTLSKTTVPRLLEQLTTYREFRIKTKRDRLRLRREVQRAAKEVFDALPQLS